MAGYRLRFSPKAGAYYLQCMVEDCDRKIWLHNASSAIVHQELHDRKQEPQEESLFESLTTDSDNGNGK
jgi:hypothetical protein